MFRRSFIFLLAVFTLAPQSWAFEFQPCQVIKEAVSVDAHCAVLQRAENPEDPNGSQIELSVAKFPARTPEPAEDAFTIIQGGPGMSSIDLYLSLRNILAGIQSKRDILVVDQRGTGRSNMLTCEQTDEPDYTHLDPNEIKQIARACLNQLGSDARYYTTSIAVQDLDAVRAAAGYEQLSIYGVSYGTRVAQHYVRRYPERSRLTILDGVADVGLNLAGSEIALRSQQAFDRIIERCNADTVCAKRFGDLAIKFSELRARLKTNPVSVRFAHPVSGVFIDETITEQHLLAMVRLMPYATESLALLPLLLSEAHAGNYLPMAAQAVLTEEQFAENYAYAMNNTVVCSEDAPFLQAADLQGQDSTYFGSLMAESLQALCEVWPQGPIDPDFRDAFVSEVPTLLLSGETDPITPPENAARAAQMFVNSKNIVVPGHGHGVISRGCLPQLIQAFVESGDVETIDSQCVQRERAMPFFIDPAGPTP